MNAQQLRNSILQQAIQGKLVPQDPNDEPASVLLQRIRKEKERPVKEGKLKKKDLESKPIEEDEIPFEIPESWEWCRIENLFIHASGKQQSSSSNGKGTPQKFITTSNLYWGRFVLDKVKVMNFTDEEIKTCSATKGDLLVCEGGAGYGRSAIWDKDYDICLQNHVHRLRPVIDGICEYVYYFIYYLKESNQLMSVGTAMPGLSANKLKSLVLPLPPLAEQRRIVAKIEELMPLVERYGKAQQALDQLNESLPARLRQSILQEAIQGRLVPQDPKEEPASELLKRIRKEKEQLVKEGKLKKKDLESKSIEEDEIPFEVPEGWEYVRLGELVYNQTGLSYSKGDLEKKVSNPIRVLRGGNIQNGSWCIKGDDVMIAPEFVKKPNLSLQKNTFITPAVTSLEHLGKTALIVEDHNDIVAGGFVLYLIPYYRQEDTYIKYLSYFFQTLFYNKFCKSIANKSGQAFWNLSRQKLMELTIPLPPLSEQKRIVAKVEELFGVMG